MKKRVGVMLFVMILGLFITLAPVAAQGGAEKDQLTIGVVIPYQIGWFAAVVQLDYRGENLAVGVTVKVRLGKDLQNRIQRLIVQQDSPQNGLLRFEVLRRHLMQGGIDVFHC